MHWDCALGSWPDLTLCRNLTTATTTICQFLSQSWSTAEKVGSSSVLSTGSDIEGHLHSHLVTNLVTLGSCLLHDSQAHLLCEVPELGAPRGISLLILVPCSVSQDPALTPAFWAPASYSPDLEGSPGPPPVLLGPCNMPTRV